VFIPADWRLLPVRDATFVVTENRISSPSKEEPLAIGTGAYKVEGAGMDKCGRRCDYRAWLIAGPPHHVNPASFWPWRKETNNELGLPLLRRPRKVEDGALPFAGKHGVDSLLRVRAPGAYIERVQDAVPPFLGQAGAHLTVHLIRPSWTFPPACSLIRHLQTLGEAEKQQEKRLAQAAATPLINAVEPVG
jgi:hypothetical protein